MDKDNEIKRSAEDDTKVFSAQSEEQHTAHGDGNVPHRIRNVHPGEHTHTPRHSTKNEKPNYLKLILIVLIVLTVAAIFCLVMVGAFYRPSVDTGTPFDTDIPIVTTDPVTDKPVGPSDDTTAPPVTEEPAPVVKYTRNKNIVNFLVMGKDRAAANTDVIMIVNFNIEKNTVNIVQLPRDTYIEYDNRSGRINTIYSHYLYNSPNNISAKEQRKYAMAKTAEAIEAGFCVQIDYYALVFLDVFADVVDAMGGVYVDVPCDMQYIDDTPGQELNIDLKKGYQRLDGNKAEQFVRFRSGYLLADISRMDAQKLLLSAMLQQLKSNLTVSSAVNIVKTVLDNLTTDVSLADAQYYVTRLRDVDLSKMTMLTLAGDGCQIGASGAWMYVVNRIATLDTVNKYLNVYNEDITDEIFDSGRRLTDTDDEVMMKIYASEDYVSKPVNGDNANDELDFPHY